jgi:hypothetical protein
MQQAPLKIDRAVNRRRNNCRRGTGHPKQAPLHPKALCCLQQDQHDLEQREQVPGQLGVLS